MSMNNDAGNLVKGCAPDLGPIGRDLQKAAVARQMATIGRNIDDLIQSVTPSRPHANL